MNPSIQCPICHETENRLLRISKHRKFNYLRRRRQCKSCGSRFSTLEIIEKELTIEEAQS